MSKSSRPEVLAIIQARGGSKSIPRKNLFPLAGHPLVAFSIISALSAKTVTRTIVSTDCEEIADVSRLYGAEVPFLRPSELATDDAPDFPLFEHALQWLKIHDGYTPYFIVQLRPTTPFRPCGLVDKAVQLLVDDPSADCVRGVTTPTQNPYKMWTIGKGGYLTQLLKSELPEPYNLPRQKLPPTYWQTGHIDVIRYDTIINKHSLTGNRIRPILVDIEYSVDIDDIHDFEYAEWILSRGLLDIDSPSLSGQTQIKRSWPKKIALVVFDFDGVFTDNRVWVSEDGHEAVACHRGDGMGLGLLRASGIDVAVISTESNPVVTARCQKLGLDCIQSVNDKSTTLRSLAADKKVDLENVIYVGNDVNDLDCMLLAGYSIAVADAHPTVLKKADYVLRHNGGHGAVREVCDLIINRKGDSADG